MIFALLCWLIVAFILAPVIGRAIKLGGQPSYCMCPECIGFDPLDPDSKPC